MENVMWFLNSDHFLVKACTIRSYCIHVSVERPYTLTKFGDVRLTGSCGVNKRSTDD